MASDKDWLWAIDKALNEPASRFDQIYWTIALGVIGLLTITMIVAGLLR